LQPAPAPLDCYVGVTGAAPGGSQRPRLSARAGACRDLTLSTQPGL